MTGINKVKRESKDQNDQIKMKRRKRRKDLEKLRNNVFAAKQQSLKRGPFQAQLNANKSSKNSLEKMLNNFADDIQTQGLKAVDEKKTKKRTICTRLLPEPAIGIFKNGAKSKLVRRKKNSNTDTEARFRGEMYKLLGGDDDDANSPPESKISSDVEDNAEVVDGSFDNNKNENNKPDVDSAENNFLTGAIKGNSPFNDMSCPKWKSTGVKEKIQEDKAKSKVYQLKCRSSEDTNNGEDYETINLRQINQLNEFTPADAAKIIEEISGQKKYEKKLDNKNIQSIKRWGHSPVFLYEEFCAEIHSNFSFDFQQLNIKDPIDVITKSLHKLYNEHHGKHMSDPYNKEIFDKLSQGKNDSSSYEVEACTGMNPGSGESTIFKTSFNSIDQNLNGYKLPQPILPINQWTFHRNITNINDKKIRDKSMKKNNSSSFYKVNGINNDETNLKISHLINSIGNGNDSFIYPIDQIDLNNRNVISSERERNFKATKSNDSSDKEKLKRKEYKKQKNYNVNKIINDNNEKVYSPPVGWSAGVEQQLNLLKKNNKRHVPAILRKSKAHNKISFDIDLSKCQDNNKNCHQSLYHPVNDILHSKIPGGNKNKSNLSNEKSNKFLPNPSIIMKKFDNKLNDCNKSKVNFHQSSNTDLLNNPKMVKCFNQQVDMKRKQLDYDKKHNHLHNEIATHKMLLPSGYPYNNNNKDGNDIVQLNLNQLNNDQRYYNDNNYHQTSYLNPKVNKNCQIFSINEMTGDCYPMNNLSSRNDYHIFNKSYRSVPEVFVNSSFRSELTRDNDPFLSQQSSNLTQSNYQSNEWNVLPSQHDHHHHHHYQPKIMLFHDQLQPDDNNYNNMDTNCLNMNDQSKVMMFNDQLQCDNNNFTIDNNCPQMNDDVLQNFEVLSFKDESQPSETQYQLFPELPGSQQYSEKRSSNYLNQSASSQPSKYFAVPDGNSDTIDHNPRRIPVYLERPDKHNENTLNRKTSSGLDLQLQQMHQDFKIKNHTNVPLFLFGSNENNQLCDQVAGDHVAARKNATATNHEFFDNSNVLINNNSNQNESNSYKIILPDGRIGFLVPNDKNSRQYHNDTHYVNYNA